MPPYPIPPPNTPPQSITGQTVDRLLFHLLNRFTSCESGRGRSSSSSSSLRNIFSIPSDFLFSSPPSSTLPNQLLSAAADAVPLLGHNLSLDLAFARSSFFVWLDGPPPVHNFVVLMVDEWIFGTPRRPDFVAIYFYVLLSTLF